MALKSIEQEWIGFSEMVFRGCKPTETQVAEMKKAFFAGAWAMFTSIEEMGEPHISEEQGVLWLEERSYECKIFAKRLMDEYAETN